MKFATRNTSAVLAAGALLATAPVSASQCELSGARPLEIVEVVETRLAPPADGMTALQQVRAELDDALMQQTTGLLLDAVRTGFESARVAREERVETESEETHEEVAAETSLRDSIRFSALEVSDDSGPRKLSF